MTCTEGVYIDTRRIQTGDCSGPQSAQNVLLNPTVDAAVLETARGGILRAGLGFDRCDVAVVTNIGEGDHLGLNDIDTLREAGHASDARSSERRTPEGRCRAERSATRSWPRWPALVRGERGVFRIESRTTRSSACTGKRVAGP